MMTTTQVNSVTARQPISLEWPHLDSSSGLTSGISSSTVDMAIGGGDMMFDVTGDILFAEDELMDIYDSATASDVTDPSMNKKVEGDKNQGALSHLLSVPPPPGADIDGCVNFNESHVRSVSKDSVTPLPGFVPLDDGLGALRPNTSFNDFTQLALPLTTSNVQETAVNRSMAVSTKRGISPDIRGSIKPRSIRERKGETNGHDLREKVCGEDLCLEKGKRTIAEIVKRPGSLNSAGCVATESKSLMIRPTVSGSEAFKRSNSLLNYQCALERGSVSPQLLPKPAVSGEKGSPVATAAAVVAAGLVKSKRRKISATGEAAVASNRKSVATRRAAAAEAVAQFTPLAQSQVAKIRQNASLFTKTSSQLLENTVTVDSKLQERLETLSDTPNPLHDDSGVRSISSDTRDSRAVDLTRAVVQLPTDSRPMSPAEQGELTADIVPITPTGSKVEGISMSSGGSGSAVVSPKPGGFCFSGNESSFTAPEVVQCVPTTVGSAELTAEEEVGRRQSESTCKTSAEHVIALTSTSNWVSQERTGTDSSVSCATAAAAAAAAAATKRARRQNLTPDERAKQNRDRNREHARNTRLRKKAYVEELKKTLTEVVAERDAVQMEREFEARRDKECREIRFKVMEEFLKLRSEGRLGDENRWDAILDSNFVLHLPATTYRKMVERDSSFVRTPRRLRRTVSSTRNEVMCAGSKDVRMQEQIITGKASVIADAASFNDFICNLGDGATKDTPQQSDERNIRLVYSYDRSRFLMDGCGAVLDWNAKTVGAVAQGALTELSFGGSMRASFVSATNKLLCVEKIFDTGSIVSQLNHMRAPHLKVPKELAIDVSAVDVTELVDSLEVPQLENSLSDDHGTRVNAHGGAYSVTSSEKSEISSDEGSDDMDSCRDLKSETNTDSSHPLIVGVVTRRVTRKQANQIK